MRVAILLVLVAGCWRGSDGETTTPEAKPAERGASCDEVAANTSTLLEQSNEDNLKRRSAQIAQVFGRRCAADVWSMELRRCITGAKVADGIDGCEQLLTAEQMQKLRQDIELEENAN